MNSRAWHLRPIFGILLRSGVTWQETSEACKSALVEIATDAFGLHGRPTNMSRMAIITMRRELVRVGAVSELPSGELRALKRYYMPLQMDPEAVLRGGSMLADLGDTVSFNLGKPKGEQSRFAGRAINTRIRSSDVRRFRDFLEVEGQAFLERVDEWLSEQEIPPEDDASARRCTRIGAGIYGIQDERET